MWPPRRFLPLYLVWTLLCTVLFFALSSMEDPSRPKGRILSLEAGRRAVAELYERDRARFAGYEVVHVARAKAGEGAPEDRWVVLCDREPHTSLRDAVVVELRSDTGELLRTRRPTQ